MKKSFAVLFVLGIFIFTMNSALACDKCKCDCEKNCNCAKECTCGCQNGEKCTCDCCKKCKCEKCGENCCCEKRILKIFKRKCKCNCEK